MKHDLKQEWNVADLFSREECLSFLDIQKERIQAPNTKTAASLIIKKHAQLLIRRLFGTYVENGTFERVQPSDASLNYGLNLNVTKLETVCGADSFFFHLFHSHLTPMIDTFHATTRIPKRILWENVAVRVNSFFRQRLEAEETSGQQKARSTDLATRLRHAKPYCFGTEGHPFVQYLNDENFLHKMNTRTTCCYFYRIKEKSEDLNHCLICPIGKKSGCD